MFTACHQVARTPPAFFSLELSRPLRSISTTRVLSPRSARPIATALPTTPAPITIKSKRSPTLTRLILSKAGAIARRKLKSLETFERFQTSHSVWARHNCEMALRHFAPVLCKPLGAGVTPAARRAGDTAAGAWGCQFYLDVHVGYLFSGNTPLSGRDRGESR